MNRIFQLSFRRKLIILFASTLLGIFSVSSVIMTITTYDRSRNEAERHLSLITEQVLLNYRMIMESMEKQVFNVYNSLDIPEIMQECQKSGEIDRQALQRLQYNMNQMVSESYPIDYVMIHLLDGTEIHTGRKLEDGEAVTETACLLYDTHKDATRRWIRAGNGGVYIIQDVYTIFPLKRVGKIIIKVADKELFKIGEESEHLSYSLMLFNKDKEHIITTGSIPEGLQQEISQTFKQEIMNTGVRRWDGEEFYYIVKAFESWQMIGTFPMAKLNSVRASIITIGLLISVIGLVIGITFVILMTNRLSRQLNALTESMSAVADGEIIQNVPIYSHDDVGLLADNFNVMTREINDLLNKLIDEEKTKKDIEIQLIDYRYRSLQTQIRPHFIYNALETVNAMAKINGNRDISRVVQLISRYFRTNTKNSTRQFIPVREEFKYLKDYTEIHKYIHGEKLDVFFSHDESSAGALIPTMILQPILENALEYGIRPAATGKTEICVDVETKDGERLHVTVTDNGPGMTDRIKNQLFTKRESDRSSKSGIGLFNVAERLRILYEEKAEISVESGEEGTCVSIRIPLIM